MKNVIIIDDSLLIRLMLKKFLTEEMGLKVVAMGVDGNDAVILYQKHKPDLMILDLNMPEKDGILAFKELFEEFPTAKIILCSTIKDSSVIVNALNSGISTYIKKPLTLYDPQFVKNLKIDIEEVIGFNS